MKSFGERGILVSEWKGNAGRRNQKIFTEGNEAWENSCLKWSFQWWHKKLAPPIVLHPRQRLRLRMRPRRIA
jgi:hypothetical protein